jgi:hypothetical protein
MSPHRSPSRHLAPRHGVPAGDGREVDLQHDIDPRAVLGAGVPQR